MDLHIARFVNVCQFDIGRLFRNTKFCDEYLNVLGPIHTKDARFFCCGNSAADISKPHTFKWDPLADDVLEAA